MDDSELVAAARGQDRQAFGGLVERHRQRVLSTCYRVVGDVAEAEDLTHETFVEAFLKLDQLREPARFGGWVRSIALNLCRMWLRRRPAQQELLDERVAAAEPVADKEAAQLLQVALGFRHLSDEHRIILVLHYLEGLSYGALSTYLEVPKGTVMSRLFRARQALRAYAEAEPIAQEEVGYVSLTEFKQEVDAEIAVLLSAFGPGNRQARRLSVLLEHAPLRFAALMAEVGQEQLDHLAFVLRRLPSAMGPVVEQRIGADPALAGRAARVLRAMVSQAGQRRRGGFRDMPAAEIYWLADAILSRSPGAEITVRITLDLLPQASTPQVTLLLIHVLLCGHGVAFPVLLQRYSALSSIAELQAQPYILQALSRMGQRFADVILHELEGTLDVERERLWLAAAEAVASCMRQPPKEGAALLEAVRSEERLAPLPLGEREQVFLRELVDRVASRLDRPEPEVCEAALRVMAAAGDGRHAPAMLGQLQRPQLSLRCTAMHVIAELGIDAAAEALLRAVGSAQSTEVRAAMAALSRLKVERAVPRLIAQLGSSDPEVEEGAIVALGELGGDRALAAVRDKLQHASERARRAAAHVLYRRPQSARSYQPSSATRRRLEKLRGDAVPLCKDNIGVAIRFALDENRTYEEVELTRRIARFCADYSATRRHLIEQGLMTRQQGHYALTEFGQAVWRVEHAILQQYPFPKAP